MSLVDFLTLPEPERPVSFHAVVNTGGSFIGAGYIEVASLLDGIVQEIADPSWDPLLGLFADLAYPGTVLPEPALALPEAWVIPSDDSEPSQLPEAVVWDGASTVRITIEPPSDGELWILFHPVP